MDQVRGQGSASTMLRVRGKGAASTMLRVRGKGAASVKRAHLAVMEDDAAEEAEVVLRTMDGKECLSKIGTDGSKESKGNDGNDDGKGNNKGEEEGKGSKEGKGSEERKDSKESEGSEESDGSEDSKASKEDEGNEDPSAVAQEVEFDAEDELEKLSEPPPVLKRADFVEKYGFKDEGYLPNCLTKWEGKRFDDRKCVALFGKAVGPRGRYGYYWNQVKSLRMQKRIIELLQALYQRESPRTILPHKMAKGIVLEEEKIPVNWAAYEEATNKTQRQLHARNLIRLEKMKAKVKDTGKVTQCAAWRKLHVDPQEMQSEVCEGRGSSMGGIVLEEGECNSRLEYLGQLLAVENFKLENRMEAQQKTISAQEKYMQRLNEHKGMLKLMKVKKKAYDKQLDAMTKDGTVDLKLTQKVDAYNELICAACRKVKNLEKFTTSLKSTVSEGQKQVLSMQMLVRALKEEHAYLRRASCGFHLQPLPLVYVGGEADNGEGSIQAGNCSLCNFPFPHSEMIVSACRHLYHPWCALVNFTEGTECSAVGCKQVQPIEWIMSFGWRGVRGCGHPGGGSEEWTKLTTECAIAIREGLAAKTEATKKLLTATQQHDQAMADLEALSSSDGEGEGERGNSATSIGVNDDKVNDEHRGNLADLSLKLQEQAQAAISETTTLLATTGPPAPISTGMEILPFNSVTTVSKRMTEALPLTSANNKEEGGKVVVRGCSDSFCIGCKECTRAMQNAGQATSGSFCDECVSRSNQRTQCSNKDGDGDEEMGGDSGSCGIEEHPRGEGRAEVTMARSVDYIVDDEASAEGTAKGILVVHDCPVNIESNITIAGEAHVTNTPVADEVHVNIDDDATITVATITIADETIVGIEGEKAIHEAAGPYLLSVREALLNKPLETHRGGLSFREALLKKPLPAQREVVTKPLTELEEEKALLP